MLKNCSLVYVKTTGNHKDQVNMNSFSKSIRFITFVSLMFSLSGCFLFKSTDGDNSSEKSKGKNVLFVGVDISGSFLNSKYFNNSISFLSHYIYAHLNRLGNMDRPRALFVGSIGGAKANEPKTFFPIQDFEHRSVKEIESKLKTIFPRNKQNPFTDYTAFFNQIAVTVRNRNLVLKPIEIMMLSDGIPDAPKKNGKHDYRSIRLDPLENLARNITLRVLYTSAVVGMNWQTEVPRKRVKVWTQDDRVMKGWNSSKIMIPGKPFEEQTRFFNWVSDNVDFKVRLHRVD